MITGQQAALANEAPAPAPVPKSHLFKNILFATDFAPASKRALKYAASLARRYGSTIYLTHVINVDGYPMVSPEYAVDSIQKQHAEADQGFRELMKTGELVELPYKVLVQEGTLWPSLEDLIKLYKIDLLVVGTHGAGTVEKMLIGSGAEEIFRKARVPVLTVGPWAGPEPEYEIEFKNILFATDFGLSAEREAEFAHSLAQEHCARLKVFHVMTHPEDYGKEVEASRVSYCIAKMRELMEMRPEVHCKLDFAVAEGDPVEQILRAARECGANLIVMGAKGKSSLAGNRPRTKAYRVVTGAHCPVLTIRS
jgi:nucleotide-binding universal stress UspA family protein